MPVKRFEITNRFDFAEGKPMGEFGVFEQIDGQVTFAVDPLAPANERVFDLELAPRNEDGLVEFSSDFSMVTPKSGNGNGKLIIDVPNRGNKLVASMFHRVPAVMPEDRDKPGDAFLCRQGYTYLSIGWQWDAQGENILISRVPEALKDGERLSGEIMMKLQPDRNREYLALVQLGQLHPPYPVNIDASVNRLYVKDHGGAQRQLIDRDRWSFSKKGETSDRHITLDGDFEKGRLYELVYETTGAPVVGCGLLAIRDIASCLKHNKTELLDHGFDQAYAFGVSQTGRVLRTLLYEGLNVDESSRKVYDGLFLHIAGGQRGDFNHRFAQPTVADIPSFGQRFPFSPSLVKDSMSGREDGLLARLAPEHTPNILIANTSWEYWRGDASLNHIHDSEDLDEHPNVRTYLMAGTHHIGGILINGKQFTELPTGLKAELPLNVVNPSPLNRAFITRLDEWCSQGLEPPASRHPRIDDATAVTREKVLEEFRDRSDVALLAPEKLGGICALTFSGDYDGGITDHPVQEGSMYPCYVSAINSDYNETAGIQLPDTLFPLGCHTGWNPMAKETGAGDQAATFAGFTLFFSAEEVLARYQNRDNYLQLVTDHADSMISEGLLLTEDKDWMVRFAGERFDAATAK